MYAYYDIIEIQTMGKPTPHSYILPNDKIKICCTIIKMKVTRTLKLFIVIFTKKKK